MVVFMKRTAYDKIMNTPKFLFLLCSIALLAPSCNEDDDITATVYGIVSDADTGAAIEGVSVEFNYSAGTTETDSNGRFQLANLYPRDYTITFRKNGYATDMEFAKASAGQRKEISKQLRQTH
jgi:hypothetical protein